MTSSKIKFQIGFWSISFIVSSAALILIYQYLCRTIICNFSFTILSYLFLSTWAFLQLISVTDIRLKLPSSPIYFKVFLGCLIFATFYFHLETLKISSLEFYTFITALSILITKHASKMDLFTLLIILPTIFLAKQDLDVKSKSFQSGMLFLLFSALSSNAFEYSCRRYRVGTTTTLITSLPYSFITSTIFSTFYETKSFQNNQFSLFNLSFIIFYVLIGFCTLSTQFNVINNASTMTFHICETLSAYLLIFVTPYFFGGTERLGKQNLIHKVSCFAVSLIGVLIFMINRMKLIDTKNHKSVELLTPENPQQMS